MDNRLPPAANGCRPGLRPRCSAQRPCVPGWGLHCGCRWSREQGAGSSARPRVRRPRVRRPPAGSGDRSRAGAPQHCLPQPPCAWAEASCTEGWSPQPNSLFPAPFKSGAGCRILIAKSAGSCFLSMSAVRTGSAQARDLQQRESRRFRCRLCRSDHVVRVTTFVCGNLGVRK